MVSGADEISAFDEVRGGYPPRGLDLGLRKAPPRRDALVPVALRAWGKPYSLPALPMSEQQRNDLDALIDAAVASKMEGPEWDRVFEEWRENILNGDRMEMSRRHKSPPPMATLVNIGAVPRKGMLILDVTTAAAKPGPVNPTTAGWFRRLKQPPHFADRTMVRPGCTPCATTFCKPGNVQECDGGEY